MAKVRLQNTTTHDITVQHRSKESGSIAKATIPAAKQDPDDIKKLIPGEAEVDADLLEAASQRSVVVRGWFDDGSLRPIDVPRTRKAKPE